MKSDISQVDFFHDKALECLLKLLLLASRHEEIRQVGVEDQHIVTRGETLLPDYKEAEKSKNKV